MSELAASPRARRHDANFDRILEAALALIAEGGIDAVSMSRLAAAVDYTPGALYRYVASKDELLARLVERVLDQLRVEVDRVLGELPARSTPLVRALAALAAYRAFAVREPQRFGLLAMTMASPQTLMTAPAEAQAVVARMLRTLAPLAEALGAAAATAQLAPGDPIERALCLFGLTHGLLMLRKQAPHAPGVIDLDRLITTGTHSLLVAWGASLRAIELAQARATSSPAGSPA